MRLIKLLAVSVLLIGLLGSVGTYVAFVTLSDDLPQMIKVEDYKPLLVSEVYARDGEKIGEYFRQIRTLIPYEKIPKRLVESFLAAEDDTFFEHGGINYIAIMRAFLVNLTSGEKRQGASTITQQVARSLILASSEKTYTRKIKEIILSYRMEQNLKKEEILYLYLNQIFFGAGAYGVGAAADVYFRKTVDQLTLAEMAILAGLPQAPSSYSPMTSPQKAKARQRYVLDRMAKVGFITPEEKEQALNEPVKVYVQKEFKQIAPYFVETIRQLLVQELGEKAVLDEGLRIHTSIDYKAQQEATAQVQKQLREIDKRQGYRGPLRNIESSEEREQFLLATRKKLQAENTPIRIIKPDGNVEPEQPLKVFRKKDERGNVITNVPEYMKPEQIVEALVLKVDDTLGLTTVQFAEGLGLIDLADMEWARKPDNTINADSAPKVSKPSAVLKVGDVILVKVLDGKFKSERLDKIAADKKKKAGGKPVEGLPKLDDYAKVALEQNPIVEAGLISFDLKTQDVIAMVGGYEFVRNKNEFNRTIQAKRQTGSSFKTIVYAAALDKGFTPATPIQDSPIVYDITADSEGQEEEQKLWKPHNHGQKFMGDILFRNALIRSLNIPTIKILESVGVTWVLEYAKRLGIVSPLNADLSLGLGSSSITLYEMSKAFAQFARLGQRIRPVVIHKVLDKDGKVLLENISLDKRFEQEITPIEAEFEEKRKAALEKLAAEPAAAESTGEEPAVAEGGESTPPKPQAPRIFFQDPNQLIAPQTAYVMTTLLSATINDEGGTAGRARALGRPVAGKTGSTNGYFDGWFVGYTAQIATGVWVGFDEEKSLGPGEVGGRTALPIWLEYMKAAHKDLPIQDFPVPSGIVFANIDNLTGKLASSSSGSVVRQAFVQGTEPAMTSVNSPTREDETEFLKKDLSE